VQEFDKNANSIHIRQVGVFALRLRVSLATIGVCVFWALASVSAFFVFREKEKQIKQKETILC
jgi:hypothetical protein